MKSISKPERDDLFIITSFICESFAFSKGIPSKQKSRKQFQTLIPFNQ